MDVIRNSPNRDFSGGLWPQIGSATFHRARQKWDTSFVPMITTDMMFPDTFILNTFIGPGFLWGIAIFFFSLNKQTIFNDIFFNCGHILKGQQIHTKITIT